MYDLGMLWAEAERFGDPELKRSKYMEIHYEASISFNTKGGSSVWARGKAATPCEALQEAINEASALSAGVMMCDR